MDMKKILQTIDNANTEVSSSEMQRLRNIVEGKGPLNRSTPAESIAMQHYAEPKKTITAPVLNVQEDARPSMIGKYFKAVEEELQESAQRGNLRTRQLAERVTTRLNELSTATLASYKKKAGADASKADKEGDFKRGDKRFSGIVKATKKQFANDEQGVAEGPTDDPRFQKMMGKIQKSTPTPMSGYVALSFANEGRSKKIKGVKHNGKPMPDVIDDPEEFLGGNIEFTPDQIEQKLMAIGEKYGWDSIDPGQGQGYTEMFFDTSREYTSKNQSRLAANIVRTVNEINKFFNSINRSLQSTGLPGYTTDVWQGMGPSDDINQIEDLTQIISIAKKQGIEEGSTQKDMNGQTCEKCKKDKYQERSQHDDMEGKVTCSCGNRVNRWKNYKEKDVAEGREGKDLDKIRDKYNKYDEAANPAQQAAIAIAKKKAGKK